MYIDVKDPKNVTYGSWKVTNGDWSKVNIQIDGYEALINGKATGQYIEKGDFSDSDKLQDEKVDVTYKLADGNKGADLNIKGNHGSLDSISIVNNKFNVVGTLLMTVKVNHITTFLYGLMVKLLESIRLILMPQRIIAQMFQKFLMFGMLQNLGSRILLPSI